LIPILLFSFSFSECDQLNQLQCSSNTDCEWIENIETEWCSANNQNECLEQDDSCYWYPGGFYLGPFCSGGSYEVDNSYCQENSNPPDCPEMGQAQCNNNSDCQWVENIETENCHDILDCTGGCNWQDCEAIEGCWWHFGTAYYDPSGCYGEHEADNSYCEESDYIQGDLNGDTTLNVLDVIILVDIILNGESSDLADINNDGMINILDVITLINIILE
jgi:hypothetical protein